MRADRDGQGRPGGAGRPGALNLHPKGLEEARRRGLLRPGQAGYEEANRWYESFFGGGAADRKQVLDELKPHAGQLDAQRVAHEEATKLAEEYAEAIDDGAPRRLKEDLAARRLEAERRARAADKAVADNQAARDENYRRYRELPEEQHAWAEQEEYQRAMAAEREAKVAAKEAEEARRRAEEAARRAEEEGPATERRPGAEVDDPSHVDDEDAVWDPDRAAMMPHPAFALLERVTTLAASRHATAAAAAARLALAPDPLAMTAPAWSGVPALPGAAFARVRATATGRIDLIALELDAATARPARRSRRRSGSGASSRRCPARAACGSRSPAPAAATARR